MKIEIDEETKKNLLWMEVNFRSLYERANYQYDILLADTIRRVLAGTFDLRDLTRLIEITHMKSIDAYAATFIVSNDELKVDPWVVPGRISSVGVALKKAAIDAGIDI